MWGGATRVPEPEELEGLTGIKFPLNSTPMGITPLGFLMRRNKKGRGRDRLSPSTPITTSTHLPSILLSIMPISGNTFAAIGGHGTITKYDHRAHTHSRIDFRDPYPSTRDIVERRSEERRVGK